MNAICSFCICSLLTLSSTGFIRGQPRAKQILDGPATKEIGISPGCPEPFFACLEGSCIPPNWTCDGENDCDGGEDEDEGFCSVKNIESGERGEAIRPPRSPEKNGGPENATLLYVSQHHLLNEKSSVDKKHLAEDQFFKSNKEFAKELIRETENALYPDQLLNAEPQIQRLKGTRNVSETQFPARYFSMDGVPLSKVNGTKFKHSFQKNSSNKKLPKSLDNSFETQNEDLSSESDEEKKKPDCCGTKHSRTQYLEHDEGHGKRETNLKNLDKIDALSNITADLLSISETLKSFEIFHNKDCINKECFEEKRKHIISKLTCPYHFQFIVGSCIYVQVYPPVTWQEASSLCESHGGKLLTIQSTNYYENLLLQMEHDKQRSYSFWIGASNSGGLWTWVDDTPFNSLSLWGFTLRKNSKNLKLSENHPNQCAFLDGNLLSYVNGASCSEEKGFICKSIN